MAVPMLSRLFLALARLERGIFLIIWGFDHFSRFEWIS
jgi:hypothetical protein